MGFNSGLKGLIARVADEIWCARSGVAEYSSLREC